MFDFSNIIDLLKVEPGHGLVQSVLLFMIWLSSRGLKKAVSDLHNVLGEYKYTNEGRLERIEGRLARIESKQAV